MMLQLLRCCSSWMAMLGLITICMFCSKPLHVSGLFSLARTACPVQETFLSVLKISKF